MENWQIITLFRSRLGTMILWGLIFGAAAFFGLSSVEKPYQSQADFLVVQTNAADRDFYTQFKSSEYLGNVLGDALYSDRFIDALIDTGKVNKEFLPFDEGARLKAWRHMVTVKKNQTSGILTVVVTGDRDRDVSRIMDGIAQVLIEKNSLFRGGDEKSVDIRILSGPITEPNPTPAKLVEAVLLGFLAGFFLTAFVLVVKNEARYRSLNASELLDAKT